jgi:hypothetical protein
MANAHNDSDRLRCLQNAVNMELHKRGNSHLSVTIGQGTFSNFLSLEWHRVSEYSLTSGLLGHMFLFGDTNTDRQLAQLRQYNWIHSTQTNMSLANAREYFEIPICLPQGVQSGNYLERLDVINSVILPPDHPFRLYI